MREFNTIVVGTGAAGYATACRLKEKGVDVAIVTEGVMCGTSRNTGSDKQTYYKLGMGGSAKDSVREMAHDLFAPGAVDGDTALCEAACSARAFSYLGELGVPFPHTEYGEYVGYKTDHDPYARATSAGPLTSKFMTEALSRRADQLDVTILNGLYVTRVLTDENGVVGLSCLNLKTRQMETVSCAHVVLATGGPAGIYSNSVYPICHNGASGLAVSAGASMQNLTEWQYGLASIAPRWNVSGTYVQVLPRLISVDDDGVEREFLLEVFGDIYTALSMLFLKGYQWPFDSKRAITGSSVIDLAVYRETVLRGRRVFLDYRTNPFGLDSIDFDRLDEEAKAYLVAADACFGTPIERLAHMNQPAIELYSSKGVDITKEPLEIALCAQHCNGGVAVDANWQTAVAGLYAVGEVAGTHGVARPGGSALNSGQVGALRASAHIAKSKRTVSGNLLAEQVADEERICSANAEGQDAKSVRAELSRGMSAVAGPIRNKDEMLKLCEKAKDVLANVSSYSGNPEARFRLRDTAVTVICVTTAMLNYADVVGISRGSAIYTDKNGDLRDGMEDIFRHKSGGGVSADKIQEVSLNGGSADVSWRSVRPIPGEAVSFETVWREYRENN